MTYCSNCGRPNESLYCPSCGARSAAAPPPPPSAGHGGLVMMHEGPEGTLVHREPIPYLPALVRPPEGYEQRRNQASHLPAIRQVETFDISRVAGSIHEIQRGGVTARGTGSLNNSDEGMVWEESPSPFLLLPLAIKYSAALFFATAVWQSLWFTIFVLIAATIHGGLRFWEVKSTIYRMSSQRLEITAGLLNQATVTYEAHQLGNAVIQRPLLLRFFKVGNLTIAGAPTLFAIRRPETVRDILRELGQTEASRTDKIRWR